ncbi:hypothetical protein [Streptomyces sp. NPDC092952]|uniref:hypothetical protein n=1 Tax=Streptomyces sp. NPDC092952 TaxID=3366018 RepID=UPI00381481C0
MGLVGAGRTGLRPGAEHEAIEAEGIAVTLAVCGAQASTGTWERLHLRRLGDHDDTLRRVVRHAVRAAEPEALRPRAGGPAQQHGDAASPGAL